MLRASLDPVVVDLGYGATAVTTVEMHERLRAVRDDLEVVGVEIDAERVSAAHPHACPGRSFVRGGFELGPLAGRPVTVIRALNVLRQYDEAEAARAWETLSAHLAPDGALVEGTCDELGRLAAWVRIDRAGPRTLTLAAHLPTLERPSRWAERLPKALIHHNVEGEPIHALLRELDRAWAAAAPTAVFGPRQRWTATLTSLREVWPFAGDPRSWRPGELSVPWESVRPGGESAA